MDRGLAIQKDSNLPRKVGAMGKTVQKSFCFVLFFYISRVLEREGRDTYSTEHSCKRLYMYILTGLSFFVSCLGVFRSPLNTVYDK